MGDERRALLEDTLTAAIALHERAKQHTQPVLEVHRTLLHVICDLVEQSVVER